jgi:hypothetical protein
MLRTVYETAPDWQGSFVLTADLIRSFERARLSSAKTEMARRRVRSSIRSYIVQARSLVAPRKMHFYDGLNLSDFSAFRSERIEMLPMFFEKFIEQHRVHRFVTN